MVAEGPWTYDPKMEVIRNVHDEVIARAEPASGPLMAAAPELL